jgi:hypothetical protein
MDQFITEVVERLVISEENARRTTSSLLTSLTEQLDRKTASKLIRSLPQVKSYLYLQPSPPQALGGLLSSLIGKANIPQGEKINSTFSILSTLLASGLNTHQAHLFLGLLINFIKDQAGTKVLNKIFDDLPQLRAFAA